MLELTLPIFEEKLDIKLKKAVFQNDVDEAIRLIGEYTLSKLDLSDAGITDDHIDNVTKILLACENITELNLRKNKITSQGIVKLSHFLEKNSTIKTLDISRNILNSEGLKIIAGLLIKNQVIKVLNLTNILHNYEFSGVVALKEALKKNQSLQTLFFDGNIAIGHYPYHNPIIASWFVKTHSYGDQIVALFCDALKANKTLKSLSLRDNGITDTGVENLYALCTGNNTLNSLYIGNNLTLKEGGFFNMGQPSIFSFTGAQCLANFIKNNHVLTKLIVARCNFGFTRAGIQVIIEALEHNHTLIAVDFGSIHPEVDYFWETRTRFLAKALEKNWNLLYVFPTSLEVEKLLTRNKQNAEKLAQAIIDCQLNKQSLPVENAANIKKYQTAIAEILRTTFRKSEEDILCLFEEYENFSFKEPHQKIDISILESINDFNVNRSLVSSAAQEVTLLLSGNNSNRTSYNAIEINSTPEIVIEITSESEDATQVSQKTGTFSCNVS